MAGIAPGFPQHVGRSVHVPSKGAVGLDFEMPDDDRQAITAYDAVPEEAFEASGGAYSFEQDQL